MLLEKLEQELVTAEKESSNLSVLFLDVDHFRQYNANNGPLLGDELLKSLAGLLRRTVRQTDLVARYAGEEFVIVLLGANKPVALELADKVRRAVEAFPFPQRGMQPLGTLTVSGGVATYPQDSKKAEDLVRCADEAQAMAKSYGRNRIESGRPNWLT